MSFQTEIVAYLVSQGIASSKIGVSSLFQVPIAGDVLSLTVTGGMAPDRIHNDATVAAVKPSMQVIARSDTDDGAFALAKLAYTALSAVRNQTLSGTYYHWIEPAQEPFDMGRDENGRLKVAFNIRTYKRPS